MDNNISRHPFIRVMRRLQSNSLDGVRLPTPHRLGPTTRRLQFAVVCFNIWKLDFTFSSNGFQAQPERLRIVVLLPSLRENLERHQWTYMYGLSYAL